MATRDNFILNVWKSYSEQNYITVKWRKMASLNSLFVGLTVFLSLTSSQNITLSQNQRGEEETSASASQPVQETTETSLERLDDCEEDEWSCHQKGKQSIHRLFNNRIRNIFIENQTKLSVGNFFPSISSMVLLLSILPQLITKSIDLNILLHWFETV